MNRHRLTTLCKSTMNKLTDDTEQNEYLLLALIQKINHPAIITIADLWAELSLTVEDIYSEALKNRAVLRNSDVKCAESFEYLMEEIETLKDND